MTRATTAAPNSPPAPARVNSPANSPPPVSPAAVTRGLSIQAPWSWAVVAGPDPLAGRAWKPVENRTWHTDFRGHVAVQSSTAKSSMSEDIMAFILGGIMTPEEIAAAGKNLSQAKLPAGLDDPNIDQKTNPFFHFGAIIGTVEIVGCVAYDPDQQDFAAVCRAAGYGRWLDKYPNAAYWAFGPYCLLLDNARQFTQPIPAKGRLNIYRLDPPQIAAVARALKAPLGNPVEYRAKLKAQAADAKSKATAARKPA
jgi:hypothetical protein